MKLKKLLTLITSLTICVTLSAQNFPNEMQAWYEKVFNDMKNDLNNFSVDALPKLKCKTAVEQAVYDIELAAVYRILTNENDYPDPSQAEQLRAKAESLQLKAFSDMKALVKAKAKDFVPLVNLGKDSKLYGDDMLYVLLGDVIFNNECINTVQKLDLCQRAFDVYKRKGNREGCILMKLWQLEIPKDRLDGPRMNDVILFDSLYSLHRQAAGSKLEQDMYLKLYDAAYSFLPPYDPEGDQKILDQDSIVRGLDREPLPVPIPITATQRSADGNTVMTISSNKSSEQYQFGDEATVTCLLTSADGTPLKKKTVTYNVIGKSSNSSFIYGSRGRRKVCNGTLTTDANGSATINFPLLDNMMRFTTDRYNIWVVDFSVEGDAQEKVDTRLHVVVFNNNPGPLPVPDNARNIMSDITNDIQNQRYPDNPRRTYTSLESIMKDHDFMRLR